MRSAKNHRFALKVAAPVLGAGLIGAAAFGFAATANADDEALHQSGPSSVDIEPKGQLYVVTLEGATL